MCIFVHANSAAAVSIESIFATKRTICILCTSDVQRSREQNIIDFNKCCSCETTLRIKLIFFLLVRLLCRETGEEIRSIVKAETQIKDLDIYSNW